MAANQTEEALFHSFRNGNRVAGEALFDSLSRPVAAVCWAISGDVTLVEEAVQETFLRVTKGIHTFQNGKSHRAWILQIARNTVRDILRQTQPSQALDVAIEPLDPIGPVETLLAREDRERLARLVEALPPPLREVVVLKHGVGLDNDTIAKLLKLSSSALWQRLSRARHELRQRFHEDK